MIEMLIAFMVISVGLFAAAQIVYSNLGLVQRDQNEVVAVNLAREGVELAKQQRDSNWLAGVAFDTGFEDAANPLSPDYTGTTVWDPLSSGTTYPWVDFAATDIASDAAKIVRTPQGAFANAHAAAPAITGAATTFRRVLTFHPICFDGSSAYTYLDTGVCGAGLTKVGIRVESHVQWIQASTSRDFTVFEDLYDWR